MAFDDYERRVAHKTLVDTDAALRLALEERTQLLQRLAQTEAALKDALAVAEESARECARLNIELAAARIVVRAARSLPEVLEAYNAARVALALEQE